MVSSCHFKVTGFSPVCGGEKRGQNPPKNPFLKSGRFKVHEVTGLFSEIGRKILYTWIQVNQKHSLSTIIYHPKDFCQERKRINPALLFVYFYKNVKLMQIKQSNLSIKILTFNNVLCWNKEMPFSWNIVSGRDLLSACQQIR